MQRRQSAAKSAEKSAARANRELVPRPYVVTPPSDPPTVQSNPVRKLTVDLTLTTSQQVPNPITLAKVRGQILDQTNLPVAKQFFTVRAIHAWTVSGTATGPVSVSNSLKLTDVNYGTEARDDPAPMVNARCGIGYPKVIQTTYGPTVPDTVNLASVTCTGVSTITVRVYVDYWSSSL